MSRRAVALFVALGVIWGVPYLLIKVAVRDVEPATLVFLRTASGAAVLLPIAALRGQLRPVLARWRPVVAFTFVEMGVPFFFLPVAERRLPSSVAGLLVAAVPIAGIPVSWLVRRRQHLGWSGFAGLLIGLAGVGAVVGFQLPTGELGPAALIGLVVVGYALGPAIAGRWLADVPSLGVVAGALGLCALAYAPVGLLQFPDHLSAGPAASVVTLGLVCSVLALLIMFALIAEVGPVRQTLVTYLNPAVAVALGVIFLGERFTLAMAVGFVLILSGSWFVMRGASAPMAAGGDPTPVPAVAEA